jgi:hypothetical protein
MVGGRQRLVTAAVALSLGSSILGCAGFLLRDDVEWARDRWKGYHDPWHAAAYAEVLHDAFVARAYADHPADFRQRAEEALAVLSQEENAAGSQRAALIAYRGLLLLDLRRRHEGWAELQRSMAIAPTRVAARGIVPAWGALKRGDKVAEACAQTLPAMRQSDDRFELLDLCVRNMHAPTEAAALAWAPPDALTFYRQESRRRAEAAEWAALQEQQDDMNRQMQLQATEMAVEQSNIATQAAIAAAQQASQAAAVPPP